MKTKNQKSRILWFSILLILPVASFYFGKMEYKKSGESGVIDISERIQMNNGRKWTRCIMTPDKTIYLKDSLKSIDRGKTIISHNDINIEEIIRRPEGAVLFTNRLFYALNGMTKLVKSGEYSVRAWRSTDGMQTIKEEEAVILVPEGPVRNANADEWFGIFVFKTILEMPDNSWLMTMYGNFAVDTLSPQGVDAQKEAAFMARTFVVRSTDEGRTWHYISSVAVPHFGAPVGEGFVEPAIVRLNDGRLLCIMRTGHHYPLYSSWSSDDGRTWSPPTYTGFDRGCDPSLITLHDGRLVLSWGRRFPEGWSQITPEGDKGRFVYPGEGYLNLAISEDGGETWTNKKIARQAGSCYSTIFEVEPNIIFCQADQWCWRIKLKKSGLIN